MQDKKPSDGDSTASTCFAVYVKQPVAGTYIYFIHLY